MVKKGSLNLSINAIVVLILAVTMLGLGLMFMKNMFGKSISQLEEVGGDIKNQMIERIRDSPGKLTFMQEDFEIKKSEEKEYYYGVMNELDLATTFGIEFSCDNAMDDEADVEHIGFKYLDETVDLERNDIDVQKVVLKISPQAVQTTYRCKVEILDGSDVYAKKNFYVTVR